MDLPKSLRPLRHRAYARLWFGAFTSNVGTWMETVGIGILIQSITGKAGWTGLVAAAGFAPLGLFGPIGGALADRHSRRALLIITTTLEMFFAGVLTFMALVHYTPPILIVFIAFFGGTMASLGIPSFQAMLPDLVPAEELSGAIALSSAQFNLGRVIGPVLAGLAIAFGNYTLAFAINTLSFLAVIIAVWPIKLPSPGQDESHIQFWQFIKDGLSSAVKEPGIRSVILLFAVNSFFAAPFIALIPAVADKMFGNETRYTPILVIAQGVGAVTMALILGSLTARFGKRRVLFGVLSGLPIALMMYGLAPNIWFGAIALFVVSFFYLGSLSTFMTIAQLRSPRALRGRIASGFMLMLGTLYPIGSILQGVLSDKIGGSIGLRLIIVMAASLMIVCFVSYGVLRPDATHALDTEPVIA